MATQTQIAKLTNLDVSSVNKILCGTRKFRFREETIRRVMKTAKQLKYSFNRATKATMRVALETLFPEKTPNTTLVILRGVSRDEVIRIKKMLYKGYKVAKEGRLPS
jgi:DNA-binding LacI/PurR family transcriptional regulator